MERRELLKMIALLTGGVVIGGEVFLTGCKSGGSETGLGFSESNLSLLDEVGETILPATKTPGAKSVKIAAFMKTIVNDCYEEKDQKVFLAGIDKLNEACKKEKGKSFIECTPQERHDFIVMLDKESKENQRKQKEFNANQEILAKEQMSKGNKDFVKGNMDTHYFTMIKQLTLWGYFTSKEGMSIAQDYVPVPGKYVGDMDYKKGDKRHTNLNG